MNDTRPVEYVGFWARVGAAFIDSLLAGVALIPLGRIFLSDAAMWDFNNPFNIMVNGVLPAIAVILFWIYRQATPGKMMIGARIVDEKTLGKPSTGQLIGRYFAYYVSTIPFLLGLIWVGIDPRKQGWHDKLAGTLVIRAK
jgi:uncharacterized RDD family membrane protein YckC